MARPAGGVRRPSKGVRIRADLAVKLSAVTEYAKAAGANETAADVIDRAARPTIEKRFGKLPPDVQDRALRQIDKHSR